MRSTLIKLLAALVAITLVAAACGDDDELTEEDATVASDGDDTAEPTGDIVAVASASGEFPTLVAAVEAAGLVETLQGEGPFTVFAPTEEAFADLLAALDVTADELLADTDLLTDVLLYHVVPGDVPAAEVVELDGQSVDTALEGSTVDISVDGDAVMVNDASVAQTDIEATNGVIHVIDTVLVPA